MLWRYPSQAFGCCRDAGEFLLQCSAIERRGLNPRDEAGNGVNVESDCAMASCTSFNEHGSRAAKRIQHLAVSWWRNGIKDVDWHPIEHLGGEPVEQVSLLVSVSHSAVFAAEGDRNGGGHMLPVLEVLCVASEELGSGASRGHRDRSIGSGDARALAHTSILAEGVSGGHVIDVRGRP